MQYKQIIKVGILALWLLDSRSGDFEAATSRMKCCVNPFARISPTRNLHFKKKACIHSRKKFEFIRVYSTSICRLKTSRASPPADEQDTKTEVQQSHDALRVSPGPEREVLSTIQCPRPSI